MSGRSTVPPAHDNEESHVRGGRRVPALATRRDRRAPARRMAGHPALGGPGRPGRLAASARWGAGALVPGVERLGAVAVRAAPDRPASWAGDVRGDRGRALPALAQPLVRRAAGALPRTGLAGSHVLGTRALPCSCDAGPLERDPSRGAVPARAIRCVVRRVRRARTSLAVTIDDEASPHGRRSVLPLAAGEHVADLSLLLTRNVPPLLRCRPAARGPHAQLLQHAARRRVGRHRGGDDLLHVVARERLTDHRASAFSGEPTPPADAAQSVADPGDLTTPRKRRGGPPTHEGARLVTGPVPQAAGRIALALESLTPLGHRLGGSGYPPADVGHHRRVGVELDHLIQLLGPDRNQLQPVCRQPGKRVPPRRRLSHPRMLVTSAEEGSTCWQRAT